METLPEKGDAGFRDRMIERAVWVALSAALAFFGEEAVEVAITKSDKAVRYREAADIAQASCGAYITDRLYRDAALERAVSELQRRIEECVEDCSAAPTAWAIRDYGRSEDASPEVAAMLATDAAREDIDLDSVAEEWGYVPE